jgi:hypothetical protein
MRGTGIPDKVGGPPTARAFLSPCKRFRTEYSDD